MTIKKGIVLVGLGLLTFGVLTFGASFVLPIKTSIEWYGKVGTLAGGGLLITILGVYFDSLKGLFVSKSVTKVADEVKPNIPIDLDVSMEKDYQCVNYLSKRFKSMKNQTTKEEGLRLLSEAHGLLYKDYHLEDKTSSVDAVPAAV